MSIISRVSRQSGAQHTAPTKKAAEEARAERRSDVKKGDAVQSTKLSLGAYLTEWLEKHRVNNGLEPTTAAGYESIVRARIIPALGGIALQRLTERHIEDFLYNLRTKGGRQVSRWLRAASATPWSC